MSNTILQSSLIIALACASIVSYSVYANPCQPIAKACMQSGYSKGAPVGKRLIKDCVEPVVQKSKTLSTTFSDEQLQECKAMIAEKMQDQ